MRTARPRSDLPKSTVTAAAIALAALLAGCDQQSGAPGSGAPSDLGTPGAGGAGGGAAAGVGGATSVRTAAPDLSTMALFAPGMRAELVEAVGPCGRYDGADSSSHCVLTGLLQVDTAEVPCGP